MEIVALVLSLVALAALGRALWRHFRALLDALPEKEAWHGVQTSSVGLHYVIDPRGRRVSQGFSEVRDAEAYGRWLDALRSAGEDALP